MKTDTRHRKMLLTLNNPGEDWTHDKIRSILDGMNLRYWCLADEKGLQEQTPHTHVFFTVKTSAVRFSTVKGLFPTAHIDPARGTSEENRDYVQKSGKWADDEKADTSIPGTFEEWGELPKENPGQRTDWDVALAMLEDGHSVIDIIREEPHLMRYKTSLEQTRQEIISEQYRTAFRELDVTYIYGRTAYGKTRYVMEKYGYENVYKLTNYQHGCFDQYACEDVLLLDEFSSSFHLTELNNILDGYPLMLNCRYSNRVACFGKVFLISNEPLENQYSSIRESTPEIWDTFSRRIKNIMHFHFPGEYTVCSTEKYLADKKYADYSRSKKKRQFPRDWMNINDTDGLPYTKE